MSRYLEIADDLRRRIASGDLQVGSPLPSISELQEEYDVPRSLNTVRRAQQILVSEGLLRTRQGARTFVIAAPSQHPLDILTELEMARDSLSRAISALRGQSEPPVEPCQPAATGAS